MKKRVCLITCNTDLFGLDPEQLRRHLPLPLTANQLDEIYVLSCRWPGRGIDKRRFRQLWGDDTYRQRLCRGLFRLIEERRWIPPQVSAIVFWLGRRELEETLLACDPDILILDGLRSGAELRKAIRRCCPHWVCVEGKGQSFSVAGNWRKYDPSGLVSIVLPTYNGSNYIRRSIESCLNQSFRNIELIVVDDGSSHNIESIVSCYKDSRLKYLRHEKNRGVAEALNSGFRQSSGQYLTWTSDDNYYVESAIEEMVRFLQTYPSVDFVYADNYILNELDARRGVRIQRNRPPEWLKVDNFIGACFLYRRKVYEIIGDFNPKTFLAEDYDYWLRVSKHFNMQRLFKPLYYYRVHKHSLSSKYGRNEVLEKVKLARQLNDIA